MKGVLTKNARVIYRIVNPIGKAILYMGLIALWGMYVAYIVDDAIDDADGDDIARSLRLMVTGAIVTAASWLIVVYVLHLLT